MNVAWIEPFISHVFTVNSDSVILLILINERDPSIIFATTLGLELNSFVNFIVQEYVSSSVIPDPYCIFGASIVVFVLLLTINPGSGPAGPAT